MEIEKGFPIDLQEFIDAQSWIYAKTMPLWPHEYIVREKVDILVFIRMVEHIRRVGYEGNFYRRPITYLDDRGMTYWTMGAPVEETTIINRCKKENTYEERKLSNSLP